MTRLATKLAQIPDSPFQVLQFARRTCSLCRSHCRPQFGCNTLLLRLCKLLGSFFDLLGHSCELLGQSPLQRFRGDRQPFVVWILPLLQLCHQVTVTKNALSGLYFHVGAGGGTSRQSFGEVTLLSDVTLVFLRDL